MLSLNRRRLIIIGVLAVIGIVVTLLVSVTRTPVQQMVVGQPPCGQIENLKFIETGDTVAMPIERAATTARQAGVTVTGALSDASADCRVYVLNQSPDTDALVLAGANRSNDFSIDVQFDRLDEPSPTQVIMVVAVGGELCSDQLSRQDRTVGSMQALPDSCSRVYELPLTVV